jgi:cell division protein FtsX
MSGIVGGSMQSGSMTGVQATGTTLATTRPQTTTVIPTKKVDSRITQDQIATRIVALKDALEAQGLHVRYISKEDALKNLQTRLPSMVKSFDQYGIDNPLPVTLYVTFADQKQFDAVMSIKKTYADMLYAGSESTTPDLQFQRNARIINLLHVLEVFFWAIVLACVVVILIFLGMIIKTKFHAMYQTIHVQQLMGASYARLKKPFFFNSFILLVLGYLIAAILIAILLSTVASIFPYLFGISLTDVFGGKG